MFCPFMLFVRLSENSALFWAQKSIASFTVAPHFVYLVDASVLVATLFSVGMSILPFANEPVELNKQ